VGSAHALIRAGEAGKKIGKKRKTENPDVFIPIKSTRLASSIFA
jgi:hypothetical protein